MIKYVFLDLDDTILDFKRSEAAAIAKTLTELWRAPSEEEIKLYSKINKSQWESLERGEITRAELKVKRFEILFKELWIVASPEITKDIYEKNLGDGHFFIEGAEQLLNELHGKYFLFLASNGTASVQKRRIKDSGIEKYFDGVFISEIIGFNKPKKEFFDAAFSKIPNFKKEEAIIVGDSISSDIAGGKNAGIKTCLFNPGRTPIESGIRSDFEIYRLSELPRLLESI